METYFESGWIVNFFQQLAQDRRLREASHLHTTFDHSLDNLEISNMSTTWFSAGLGNLRPA